jgi:tetratricopeptide (TPR) repeat protein
MDLGQPDKARGIYEQALALKERSYGPNHRELASTLHNLGNAWIELGQSDEARKLFERALAIRTRVTGQLAGW